MRIDLVRSDTLALPHGFLGRGGGVSTGLLAGLNCGLGSDDPTGAVQENRKRALAAIAPGATLVSAHQIHSADVMTVTEPWPDAARPHADALVTDRHGLALGIVTADCAPVLFADADASVIGAAHAGWKGAIGGVLEATIAAMTALGAARNRIAAVVGPCIAQANYEVDAGFRNRFGDDRFFVPGIRAGYFQFDLEAYVLARLRTAGVAAEGVHLDTYADAERFYSFRRATHRGEPDYGRQVSIITL